MPKDAQRTARKRAPAAPPRPAPLPTFASEADERAFWAEHDTADYVDWSAAERTRGRRAG